LSITVPAGLGLDGVGVGAGDVEGDGDGVGAGAEEDEAVALAFPPQETVINNRADRRTKETRVQQRRTCTSRIFFCLEEVACRNVLGRLRFRITAKT
jgi:hypothetical protein